VGQIAWGVSLPLGVFHKVLDDVQLSFIQYRRNAEFESITNGPESKQRFGSIAVSIGLN
jgi:hypothetical protein